MMSVSAPRVRIRAHLSSSPSRPLRPVQAHASCTPVGSSGKSVSVGSWLVAAAASASLVLATPAASLAADGVSFLAPKNNATVSETFDTTFSVSGLTVAPAADGVQEGSGHHHLIVDGTGYKEGLVIVKDDTHFHYGKGQEEATLTLAPGKHTLTLQFGNALHESYGAKYAKTITVTVK